MTLSKQLNKSAARRSAFTLLEVLVVVAILVILAGTAVVFVPQYLEDSKVNKAKLECKAWEDAVSSYYTNNGGTSYPNSLQDVQKYIQDGGNKLADPWNKPYQLEITDSGPIVISTGSKEGVISKKGINLK